MILPPQVMSKMRTLYRHQEHSLSPGELTPIEYKALTKPQRKNYKKTAKQKGWKPIWEALYTESDILSQIKNKQANEPPEEDYFSEYTFDE